jgi:hypothetical protein
MGAKERKQVDHVREHREECVVNLILVAFSSDMVEVHRVKHIEVSDDLAYRAFVVVVDEFKSVEEEFEERDCDEDDEDAHHQEVLRDP